MEVDAAVKVLREQEAAYLRHGNVVMSQETADAIDAVLAALEEARRERDYLLRYGPKPLNERLERAEQEAAWQKERCENNTLAYEQEVKRLRAALEEVESILDNWDWPMADGQKISDAGEALRVARAALSPEVPRG